MCIAIVKTDKGVITDKELRNCFESNPDGAGIAYAKNGKIKIIKGIFDEDKFVEAYHEAVKDCDNGNMLIHCRIGTSGHNDVTNCHPHVVNDYCVMIHNGILDVDVPKGSPISDTVIYVNDYLKPLPENFMDFDGVINLITRDIGRGNKFCFLNANGEYAIANEQGGHWKDGVWFSNYSYLNYGYAGWTKTKTSKVAGYGFGYADEDWEDEDFYEFDDIITSDEEDEILDVIDDLSYSEILKLGSEPMYNTKSKRLCTRTNSTYAFALSELSRTIYNDYTDRYYEVLDDIILGTTDNITDEELKYLIDSEKQVWGLTGEEEVPNDVYNELYDTLVDELQEYYDEFELDVKQRYLQLNERTVKVADKKDVSDLIKKVNTLDVPKQPVVVKN